MTFLEILPSPTTNEIDENDQDSDKYLMCRNEKFFVEFLMMQVTLS